MFPFRNFTVDHVVPQSRGGTDHLENLQLAQRRPAAGVPHSEAGGDGGMKGEGMNDDRLRTLLETIKESHGRFIVAPHDKIEWLLSKELAK